MPLRVPSTPPRDQQQGMLLMGVLVFLAVGTMGLVGISQRWADARQRDNEEDLLYAGLQYRQAIDAYYFRSPGNAKQFPTKLQDLVLDPRFPQPVRHIRKLYPDPLAPTRDWGLIRQGNFIVGVYSQSTGQPFRSANFDPALPDSFKSAASYKDWRFVASRANAALGAASGASAAGGAGLTPFGGSNIFGNPAGPGTRPGAPIGR
ncbi:MAG: hypothetical protein RJA44_1999 [Pseudomonadota bacterium]|jgi:type II secretory pathway pseudopilin PulG